METPSLPEKTKTLKIKIRHCLLNRLSSVDGSIKVDDKGNEPYVPNENKGPEIDLALQLNIHEEIGDVFAFEGDENNSKRRLKVKNRNGILQIEDTGEGNKMTLTELTPQSLLVVTPEGKVADWLSALSDSANAVVGNNAGNWQWINIADCKCEQLI